MYIYINMFYPYPDYINKMHICSYIICCSTKGLISIQNMKIFA